MVLVFPKTEVTINGTIEDRMISKQIDLTAGIKAKIAPVG